MATFAEIKRVRKTALRHVRRAERAADSAIERLERRIFTLLDRKTIIDRDAALTMDPLYRDFFERVRQTERALRDFYEIVSQ